VARIIVFIDESGNPFDSEIAFATAAVWCAIDAPSGREKPLESTVDSMKRYLIDDGKMRWAREIHHRGMPDDYVEYLMFMAMNRARTDNTILRNPIYWDRAPMRFTMSVSNPHAVRCLNPEMTAQGLGRFTRLSALGNLLRPFCMYQGTADIRADLILDAEVWENVIERSDPGLSRTIDNSRVNPHLYYCKSSKTPGLQIADLAAGIARQYYLKATQKAAFRLLQSNELIRFRCVTS